MKKVVKKVVRRVKKKAARKRAVKRKIVKKASLKSHQNVQRDLRAVERESANINAKKGRENVGSHIPEVAPRPKESAGREIKTVGSNTQEVEAHLKRNTARKDNQVVENGRGGQ